MFRRLGPVAFIFALNLGSPPVGAEAGRPYPRLANAFWASSVDTTLIPTLAQWDVLVLNPVWSCP